MKTAAAHISKYAQYSTMPQDLLKPILNCHDNEIKIRLNIFMTSARSEKFLIFCAMPLAWLASCHSHSINDGDRPELLTHIPGTIIIPEVWHGKLEIKDSCTYLVIKSERWTIIWPNTSSLVLKNSKAFVKYNGTLLSGGDNVNLRGGEASPKMFDGTPLYETATRCGPPYFAVN
ncbi:MAG: hypothetical protein AB7E24_18655 [Novosphingobium sp.]